MQPLPSDAPTSSPSKFRLDRFDFVLLGIVLLAAIPRLYIGVTQSVEYDGYWHVFVAQQDRWRNFIWDTRHLAHPQLYMYLLRWTLWLGKSHLAYRAIPLLAGLASVAVLGRIALKMMRSTLTAALVALTFAVCLPAILISCEVRAYGPGSLFTLVTFACFLEMILRDERAASPWPRILFAISALLACLTEFCPVFVVCALFGIAMILPLIRRREPMWKAWAREVATVGAIAVLVLKPYRSAMSGVPVAQGHLVGFYFNPAGQESRSEFLLRQLRSLFDLFGPWPTASQGAFLAIAAGLLAAVLLTLWLVRRIEDPKNLAAAATIATSFIILVELMVASLVRLYPFGGFLRQQFFLFPFVILSAFLLPDRLAAAIPRRAAYALAGVLALAIVSVSYRKLEAYPDVREKVLSEQLQRFNTLFPAPEAVYLDQYNLIAFFMHHDDWKWKFIGRLTSVPDVDIYRVNRASEELLVFRDRGRWLANCLDPGLYNNLAESLRAMELHSITLLRVAQDESPWASAELKAYEQSIVKDAGSQGLCVQQLQVHERDVYEELRTGGCTAAPQP